MKTESDAYLDAVVVDALENCFTEVLPNEREERKLDGLGIRIAQYFEWDGIKILKTFMYALEDANFHTGANKIEEWIEAIEKGEKINEYGNPINDENILLEPG